MKAIWEEYRMIVALNVLKVVFSILPKNRDGKEIIEAISEAVKKQIDRM